ncbi:MAG TPA: MFS transporter [Tepidisphaeraceae bacterium]|jgi:PAT family beta-lactamase induction signal transducer AmpG|nr:MFS transporter [Tepidisphaeraceae bacterium]
MPQFKSVFTSRRVTAMAALGFASGLPYALTSSTLQQWLKDANVDLETIGFLSLIGLPYVLKMLWAPFMDRYVPPLLGRRRGWLLLTQIAIVLAIVCLAFTNPTGSLRWVAVVALGLAFLSASQDIVVDAYRADVLPTAERGPGAATFVAGYRVALLLTGAIILILVDQNWLTWRGVYLASAGMMSLGIVATLMAPEPTNPGAPPPTMAAAIVRPLRDMVSRPDGWLVLAFVLLFRLPDSTAGTMTGPFLRDAGFSKTDIGLYRQFLGVVVAIGGTLLGGGIINRLGTRQALWLFGGLQAISNLGFWVLSQSDARLDVLISVLVIENFCGGLVTAGFFLFLMNQCRAEYSATQYALLSSLMAVAGIVVGAYTGVLVQAMGYGPFFLLTVALGLPGLILLATMRAESVDVDNDAPGFPLTTSADTMEP